MSVDGYDSGGVRRRQRGWKRQPGTGCDVGYLLEEDCVRRVEVERVAVRLVVVQTRGPVDLDHVPFRIVDVKGERTTVVEGHLDRDPPLGDLAMEGAQSSQRVHLEGKVPEHGVGEERQFVVFLLRTAAEEGRQPEGTIRGAAPGNRHPQHITVVLGQSHRVVYYHSHVMEAGNRLHALAPSRRQLTPLRPEAPGPPSRRRRPWSTDAPDA